MSELAESEVFSRIGEDGFARISGEFYRQVELDPILSPMYPPTDMQGAERRLRSFLIFRFGGPDDYLSERGHPKLRMRHGPFPIDQAARDRWMLLMRNATEAAEIPKDCERVVLAFLEHASTFLINRTD